MFVNWFTNFDLFMEKIWGKCSTASKSRECNPLTLYCNERTRRFGL